MSSEPSSKTDAPKVVWHAGSVSPKDRMGLLGQVGCVVWFTGLSGSGKSTIANVLDQMLLQNGRPSLLLDGDNIRHGLCATPNILKPVYGEPFSERFGLGFSPQDREENIRRIGEVAYLMASAGLICLSAFVSPYRKDRERVKSIVEQSGQFRFFEVFVDAPLEVCEARDPKGLYRQAREGKIPFFTGISDPYEPPEHPALTLDSSRHNPQHHAQKVMDLLSQENLFLDRSSDARCVLGSQA
jgi:adenylylsulfate kinase